MQRHAHHQSGMSASCCWRCSSLHCRLCAFQCAFWQAALQYLTTSHPPQRMLHPSAPHCPHARLVPPIADDPAAVAPAAIPSFAALQSDEVLAMAAAAAWGPSVASKPELVRVLGLAVPRGLAALDGTGLVLQFSALLPRLSRAGTLLAAGMAGWLVLDTPSDVLLVLKLAVAGVMLLPAGEGAVVLTPTAAAGCCLPLARRCALLLLAFGAAGDAEAAGGLPASSRFSRGNSGCSCRSNAPASSLMLPSAPSDAGTGRLAASPGCRLVLHWSRPFVSASCCPTAAVSLHVLGSCP
jgi:hypothetical protein